MTIERSEEALARRLVARTVDLGLRQGRNSAMPEAVSAEILSVPRREEHAASRPEVKTEAPAAQGLPFGAGYEMLSETLGKAQDVARQTALQLADAQLHQMKTLIDLQQTLLEMAQANMAASFAAAQKIVASTSLHEAVATHKRFAQDQVAQLTEQAAQLRRVATRMTGETAEPFAQYWTSSFDRIRKSFGA